MNRARREELATKVITPTQGQSQRVFLLDDTHLSIDDRLYEVVYNYRDGFDSAKLNERYNDILAKYDYIVGDWGFDQLRLRGFYLASNRHGNRDQSIDTLEDYINEYCNFGCAFFVIEQVHKPKPERSRKPKKETPQKAKNERTQKAKAKPKRRPKKKPFKEKKVTDTKQQIKKTSHPKAVSNTSKRPQKRHFTIRNTDEQKD